MKREMRGSAREEGARFKRGTEGELLWGGGEEDKEERKKNRERKASQP